MILNKYRGTNQICNDFRKHWNSESFNYKYSLNKSIKEWTGYSWIGFFNLLQNRIEGGFLEDVSNRRGGFIGFWWLYHKVEEDVGLFLQLEEKKFCIKIHITEPDKVTTENCRNFRNTWSEKILKKGRDLSLIKPEKFGKGTHMTVAVFNGDYRILQYDERVDIERTILRINEITNFISTFSR